MRTSSLFVAGAVVLAGAAVAVLAPRRAASDASTPPAASEVPAVPAASAFAAGTGAVPAAETKEASPAFAPPPAEADPVPASGGYAVLAHNTVVRAEPSTDARSVRNVGVGIIRVTFTERVERDGATWLHINDGEWVRADLATLLTPSSFRGVEVRRAPAHPFGWALGPVAHRAAPGGAVQGRPLARYDFVEVLETSVDSGGGAWHRLADGWVPADSVAVVDADARPDGVRADDFWMEVDLAEQTFAAYEGDRMVYASLVSSGLEQKTWPTRTGLFSVERRVQRGRMRGDDGTPDYYSVEDVPNAQYFDGATALHGAYWHDAFGGRKSHGCVNLPPGDAAWAFRWSRGAPRAARVWVHAPRPAVS